MGFLELTPEQSLGYLILVLLAIIVAIFGYIIYNTIRNERKAKLFRVDMKKGDEVYVPLSNGIYGEVLETKEDSVYVIVKVRKGLIYPK